MSDAPRTPDAEDTPSADELQRTAIPATIRRAPRFGRVIGTGAGIGAAAGVLCGALLPNTTGVGRPMVAIVVGVGFMLMGGLVSAVIATRLDRGTGAYMKQVRTREKAAPATNSEDESR